MKKIGKIYIIKNSENVQVYIGKTFRNIKVRFVEHMRCKNDDKFHTFVKNSDKSIFSVSILYQKENNFYELGRIEKEYVKEYDSFNNGYNSTNGGDGGYEISPEIKIKMSGENHHSYGKPRSPETKKKISEAQSGEKSHNYGKVGKDCRNYGKTHSPEAKRKMSENHPMRGKTLPPEHKQKLSEALSGEKNPMFGKHHPPEIIMKMSGENNSMYGKFGKDNPNYGSVRTPEQKQRMSENHADFNGENSPCAKLNWQQVKDIRLNINNLSRKELAEIYNVSKTTIRHIIINKAWKE